MWALLAIVLFSPPVERCTACHPVRPADAHRDVACVACHLGDARAIEAEAAHAGLEAEPGALSTVGVTCGQGACHPVEAARVLAAPMARATGIVAVTRAGLGETAAPLPDRDLPAVLKDPEPSPAEDYVRRLCAGCHLGARRDNRDDAIAARGSGCSACHLAEAVGHPTTPTFPDDGRCLGCHSRSGRISLSYQGIAERSDGTCDDPRPFPDGRVLCAAPSDVHHDAGIACVDCHLHTELMGSDAPRPFGRDAVEVSCEACHDADAPASTWGSMADAFARTLASRLGWDRPAETPVRVGRRGAALWNLVATGEGWALLGKRDGALHAVPATPEDAQHRLPGHERLTCAACHSAWTPTCPTCHVGYDPAQRQWDFGAAAEVPGKWIETGAGFTVAAPALGVRPDGRIGPAAPGMVFTFDARPAGGGAGGARWYSTFDPHTTRREGRACADCHRSAWALGLGTGELVEDGDGWRFTPARPDATDPRRAVDAWVGLDDAAPGRAPDPAIRSLDRGEREKILTVGRCVRCHPSATESLWIDFPDRLADWRKGLTTCPAATGR